MRVLTLLVAKVRTPRVGRGLAWTALAAAASLSGCQANAEVKVNTGKAAADEPVPAPIATRFAEQPRVATSRIGVYHALTLAKSAAEKPTCRCMAAHVGAVDDEKFAWGTKPPTVGDDAFVLAISDDGTPCDWEGKRGSPSIRAVEQVGNDVVVTLEEVRGGIPPARGAVVRKPTGTGDGWLVFRADRRLPYDDVLAGSESSVCRLKIPLRHVATGRRPC